MQDKYIRFPVKDSYAGYGSQSRPLGNVAIPAYIITAEAFMDINKNLIMVKGKDRTKDIRTWKYQDNRIKITFNDGATFPYSPQNVTFYKNPKEIDPNTCYVLKNNQPLSGIIRIQDFQTYIRIFYKSGYCETIHESEIRFVRSCLADATINHKFEYFKQIAHTVSLRTDDGKNILGNRYNKINFIREDSILSSYLKGVLPRANTNKGKSVVYPFGFNASQKNAVDNALNNGISIIEGPPGTGKTQTILNIIANSVIKGESVAVVSNNNSATANVLEKLEKHNLGFIAAFLGSTKNKDDFIERQQCKLPSFKSWKMTNDSYHQTISLLHDMSSDLDKMLHAKNELSQITQTYDALCVEQQYFLQYYFRESDNTSVDLIDILKMNSYNALQFWLQCEKSLMQEKPISIWQRIMNFFKLRVYRQKLYQYPLEQLISFCQKRYYEASLEELRNQMSQLEQKLSNYNFQLKMDEYADLSMRIFKSDLAKRYSARGKRKIYEINDLWKRSEEFISDYPVVLSTTYSLRSSLSDKFAYDYIIVDEASQVDLATGALAFSCAKKAVIVGDLKQLPNVVTDDIKKKTDEIFHAFNIQEVYRFSNHSLLSSVIEIYKNIPRIMLREHYRCHPKIIEFCNQRFYDNMLITLTSPKTDRPPLVVYKTVPGNHARDHVNQRQIDVITHEVLREQGLNVDNGTLGIVSPYRNQAAALREVFKGASVQAETVDKFQGQEKDTIILCTVDNEISDFTDNSNRLNVAVSRAINQLIVVTDGNQPERSGNIKDLISYIQYNNFEIIDSKVYSIFDCLYKSYAKQKETLMKTLKKISGFDSENLMYNLICEVLRNDIYSKFSVANHVPLKMLIRSKDKLDCDEVSYAMNILTHVDFVIFDKLNKLPILAVEVDGYAYHNKNTEQERRDRMKDNILSKYDLPLLRFSTVGSNEKARLIEALERLNGVVI